MKELIERYVQAKADESKAKARRVELAYKIANELEHPDEGSKSHAIDRFKVTVKAGYNRRVDWKAIDALTIGGDRHLPVKTKRELDIKGLHWIRDNQPEFYSELCACITSTPSMVQVTVKES